MWWARTYTLAVLPKVLYAVSVAGFMPPYPNPNSDYRKYVMSCGNKRPISLPDFISADWDSFQPILPEGRKEECPGKQWFVLITTMIYELSLTQGPTVAYLELNRITLPTNDQLQTDPLFSIFTR